jgi:Fur family ferric uptake transcriptional regulator
VLEALDDAEGHVTAEQVRQSVLARLGSVSVQTVYDILSALTAAGLVQCLETPGHPARFETRVGDNHHHFICRACGKTLDIDCATGETTCLTPQALPSGFMADEAEVTYWGTCSDCRGAGGTNLSCGHHTWDSAWQQAQGRDPQEGL